MGICFPKQPWIRRNWILTTMKTPTLSLASRCLALFIASLALATNVMAQSVDDCMSARVNDALSICQGIIDNGSRNSDVYWKLTSAQYQSGQTEQANKTLNSALRLYPADSRLTSLKELISTDTSEQALIARSAKLNQNSLDRGAMKISCLTKTGDVGISACKRRLELSNQDGERIRARLTELQQIQESNRLAIAAETPSPSPAATKEEPVARVQESPEPEPFAEPEPEAVDIQELIAETRRNAYKAMVSEVQSRLNDFGFNAGFPDGVPGSNTRRALSEFYRATGATPTTSITDLTIEDLDSEKLKLDIAKRKLRESQQALADGKLALAKSSLQAAEQISGLLKVPPEHVLALRAPVQAETPTPLASIQAPNVPEPAVDAVPAKQVDVTTPSAFTPSSPPKGAGSDERFAELINQIKVLQGRIQRQQSDQNQQMKALRDAL